MTITSRKELILRLEDVFLKKDNFGRWEHTSDLLIAWRDNNPCEYGDDCFDNALLLLQTIVSKWNAYIYPTCATDPKDVLEWYNNNYCFLLEEMKLSA